METHGDGALEDGPTRLGEQHKRAWKQTLEEMELIAEQRREAGFEAVATPAAHTAVVTRNDGDDETRFGLSFVIPDNHADSFTSLYDDQQVTKYNVYRNAVENHVYVVVELLAPDAEAAVFVAGQYELRRSRALGADAREAGSLNTYYRTLDGTTLGIVRHDEFEKFLPEA